MWFPRNVGFLKIDQQNKMREAVSSTHLVHGKLNGTRNMQAAALLQ